MKASKRILFIVMMGLILAGCSSKHKPIEIDTVGQQENIETSEPVKVVVEQPKQEQQSEQQPEQKNDAENEKNQVDGKYARGAAIKEQTFETTLRPFGLVTFASYEPDTGSSSLADVVFTVEKDGQVLSWLPGTSENNIGLEVFDQVDAVSFLDYNNDGYDDVIAIISYYAGTGSGAASHSVIRYYKGSDGGSFTYEREMSDAASLALAVITVQAAKDFIGSKQAVRGDSEQEATSNLEPWQQAYVEYLDKISDVSDQEGYVLIQMDGDEIPELAEIGLSEASGSRIIHYGNGKIWVTQLNRLYFDYIPGKNQLRNAEGLMDYYYDILYSIIDGKMTVVASGYYGAEDNTKLQFDEEGSPIYRYEWNGTEMSREEYEAQLDSVYDTSAAVSYDYDQLFSVDEVKLAIEGY